MKNENIKDQNRKNNLCEETELLIDEHIEGMISLKDKEIMDAHIEICKNCADYLKETSKLIKNINALSQNNVNLSVQKKNDMWEKVESKIDINRYKSEKEKIEKTKSDYSGKSFVEKYKYFLSGIAAVLVIGVIIYGVKNMKISNDRIAQQNTFGMGTYWKVSNLQGESRIGNNLMTSTDSIKEGDYIQTNYNSRAELVIANVGKVIIEPNSKVVFIKSADGNNRIHVEYGTINTETKANTKSLFIEMPSAVATGNGGSYSITIDSTGNGLVYVKSGKVDIDSPNRDAVIPAGNIVLTKRDIGVGTPFNDNATPKFRQALFNYDFGKCNETCVATLLNNAKMSDAVTLVNLIPNVEKEVSDKFYAKLANFIAPPENFHNTGNRDSIPFIDEEKLNAWIDKIQAEAELNAEKSMKEAEKSLENMKELEKINEVNVQGLEDFAKNWKIKIKTSPKGNYEWTEDSLNFDKEQFRQDMEEMQKEMKENHEINKEQLKEDMDQLKIELKEMQKELKENLNLNNEEMKEALEKANEEMKKAVKEVQRIQIPDSTVRKPRVKVYPVTPETPEDPDGE